MSSPSSSSTSSYLQTRVGSYLLLKNSLPPSLTPEYMERYEYASYYPAPFLRLVGADFAACLKSHAYYFPRSAQALEDVRYDLSSLVEFDGLMSLEANGFPRFSLLVAQGGGKKEEVREMSAAERELTGANTSCFLPHERPRLASLAHRSMLGTWRGGW